ESEAIGALESWGVARMARRGDDPEPSIEIDAWRPEEGSTQHTDFFLKAHSRALLEQMFEEAERRGWRPPAGTIVAYERVEPWPGARDPREYWRTYFVVDHVDLDGEAVANAYGSYDPNTNRPVVLLDFNRAGARQFGELTQRIVGHKLATMLGGRVR